MSRFSLPPTKHQPKPTLAMTDDNDRCRRIYFVSFFAGWQQHNTINNNKNLFT